MEEGKVKRGRKGKRVTYERGKQLSLTVPQYIDDTTLLWINSQPQFATSVWELVRRAAHNEMSLNNSQLQGSNLPLEQILRILSANKENIITDKVVLGNEKSEELKTVIQDDLEVQINKYKREEDFKKQDKIKKEEEIKNQEEAEKQEELKNKQNAALEETAATLNLVEKTKLKDNSNSEFKGLDLNNIAKRRKGSTPMSRTTGGMTQLPGNRENPLESGVIGNK